MKYFQLKKSKLSTSKLNVVIFVMMQHFLNFTTHNNSAKFFIETPTSCTKDNIQCRFDEIRCYKKRHECVYDINTDGQLKYCTSGSHLWHCKTYYCKTMYKCPQSYCVPWKRVCDGVIDCPGGADEQNCHQHQCPSMFRCGVNTCIHRDEVCDGISQCLNSADEFNCNIPKCPQNCQCLGSVFVCTNLNLDEFPFLTGKSIQYLSVAMNKIQFRKINLKLFNEIIFF
eukprot:GHVR01026320.1.p1 GENE.GHVR01026320.1~~GHVR01026320.1.p1  ORF type:complete len:237 (-),score=7.69 GHVR01026320.1:395-1075(-)